MTDSGSSIQPYEILLNPANIAYPGDVGRYQNLPGALKLQRQWLDVTDRNAGP